MQHPESAKRISHLRHSFAAGIWCLVFFMFLFFTQVSAHAGQITLAWDAEDGAAGYKIYYGTASDAYTTSVDVGNVTNYPLTLDDGHTYYLAATAYDSAKLESDFSNEITYTAGTTACSYSLSPTSVNLTAAGGSGTIAVTTQSGCSWSASTGVAWATITSGASGTGSGTVAYTVAANTGSSRTAASTIAGQIFTFTQSGVSSYTITASAGTGGSISPSGSVSVTSGSSQAFTITANAGYTVSNITVDGASVGAVNSYTFTNVTATHTIAATFTRVTTHVISASAGAGGSISPSGKTSIATGGTITYTIIPKSGYRVKYLVVDNKIVSGATSYTFANVNSKHTIKPYFGVMQVASVDHAY